MAGDLVKLYWDSTSKPVLKSFTASAAGAGSASFAVPEASSSTTHKVLIRGTSGLKKSITITVKPSIAISPKSGPGGAKIAVTLKGFKAGEVVDVRWYITSTTLKTLKNDAVASSLGTIKTTITVPTTATVGSHKVEARGTGGSKASVTFTVTSVSAASVDEAPVVSTPQPLPPASTPQPLPAPVSLPPAATAEPT